MGKKWTIDQCYEHEGEQYGRLTVIYNFIKTFLHGEHLVTLCKCSCGNYTTPSLTALRNGDIVSCGCQRREDSSKRWLNNKNREKHGWCGTRTYRIWKNIHNRIFNPKSSHYEYYGGRGIKLCEEWKKFENFLADMGECPEGCSIDRIDNNGNYEARNCKWATLQEQSMNKRSTIHIEYLNKIWTLPELAETYKINKDTLYNRLHTYHWPLEKALTAKGKRKILKGDSND